MQWGLLLRGWAGYWAAGFAGRVGTYGGLEAAALAEAQLLSPQPMSIRQQEQFVLDPWPTLDDPAEQLAGSCRAGPRSGRVAPHARGGRQALGARGHPGCNPMSWWSTLEEAGLSKQG